MSEIGTRNLGAFLVVDVGAFDQFVQGDNDQQQTSSTTSRQIDQGAPSHDDALIDGQPPDGATPPDDAGAGDGQPPQDQNDG
ncbi:hypothetical protein CDV31_005854 [Fusarium ambrosium]|uniref:Uncharacterized protein n=1 Tax=Fusarium ambrosium TaxID=131363 RepID=A0A428UGQ0_9HYPO|nr:hypothetical protein CDV31_005854 [Fusarium ambrosium]